MNTRRLVIYICVFALLLIPDKCRAGLKEDYEQAYRLYVAAGACMAAYSDRYGQLANKYLEREGWLIERFERDGATVDSRFLFATKKENSGRQTYILAFVGTETAKDMKANLKVDKVYFAGRSLEEFAASAAQQGVPPSEPKVHRGFHDFVQTGLSSMGQGTEEIANGLAEMLLRNRESQLLIVGHSRGGAAAVIAGARLVCLGVRPEQIEIITFGAPAVGNAAFAAQYEPVLNLTRVVISGDQVTGVLQFAIWGYKQFGRELLWEMPADAKNAHDMTGYADKAIKQFYDKRELVQKTGLVQLPEFRRAEGLSRGAVYVAPLKNNLPDYLSKEYRYIKQALYDEYRTLLPEYVFDKESSPGHLLKKAADAGCKWLIVPEIGGHRLKEERDVYIIYLHQAVYDVTTGNVVKAAGFSTGTFHLTPLEAFIHVCKGMTYDWLVKDTATVH